MSYQNGFVMSIVKDGHTVREDKRKVVLPFEAEYSVRLWNKNSRTAVCELFINGEKVSGEGGYVVYANSFIDIERFLGDNLNNGKRFKFAKLISPQVKDKDNFENGVVVSSPDVNVNVVFDVDYVDVTTGETAKSFTVEEGDGRIFILSS